MQDTTTPTTLKDGAYTWRAVQPYGPSTPVLARVEAGRVTLWQTGQDEGLFTVPADALQATPTVFTDALTEVLQGRTRYGTSPVEFVPADPTTIGKARAKKLHKLLSRVPCNHYGIAGRVLGREVHSLAALTEQEARRVWAFVRFMFPDFFPSAA